MTATDDFTGGTTPSADTATTTPGVGTGKYGPYDPSATDGRQTLTRGKCFIMHRTWLQTDPKSDHPPTVEGGLLWRARLLVTDSAAGSLATGPTMTNFLAAFPRVRLQY